MFGVWCFEREREKAVGRAGDERLEPKKKEKSVRVATRTEKSGATGRARRAACLVFVFGAVADARGTHPAATSSTSPVSWRSIHHRMSFMPVMNSCHSISSSKDSASRSYASRRVASRTRGDFDSVAEAEDARRSGELHEHGAAVEPSIVPYPTAVPATTVAAAPKAPSAPSTTRIAPRAPETDNRRPTSEKLRRDSRNATTGIFVSQSERAGPRRPPQRDARPGGRGRSDRCVSRRVRWRRASDADALTGVVQAERSPE